jgi:phosphate-selective porin OprO/OprP
LRFGHWRVPFGLADQESARGLTFLERGSIFAFNPFRQAGFGMHDAYLNDSVTLAVTAFGASTDSFGSSLGDRGYGLACRTTAAPYSSDGDRLLMHLGGGYLLNSPTDRIIRYRNTAEYGGPFVGALGNVGAVPAFVDTGDIAAGEASIFNGELAAILGSLHLQSECRYAVVDQDGAGRANFSGAYVEAGYLLTGEVRPYDHKNGILGRITPLEPFAAHGGIGAWEVAGRYSYLDLNDGAIAGGRLNNLVAGLNWYLNKNTKFQFNYIHAMLDRAPGGESETNIFATRAAVDF